MRLQKRLIPTLFAVALTGATFLSVSAASAQEAEAEAEAEAPAPAAGAGALTGPAVGEWSTLIEDPTVAQWQTLDLVSKVGCTVNSHILNLGGGWYFTTGGLYLYFDGRTFYNNNAETWFYAANDSTGVYFYDFSRDSGWDWRSRNGDDSSFLPDA